MNNRISNKINLIKPSATMALNAKTKELQKLGKDIINMSVGEPDFQPPKAASLAGIQAIEKGETGYTPASGLIELKEAISNYLFKYNGVEYDVDQIVASAGGKQPLYNVFQTICEKGDEIILPSPYWVSYPEQIKLSGAKPVIVRCDESTDFKLTPDNIINNITTKTKAIVLTSPNNPTGSVYTKNELIKIAEILRDYPQVLIISDEIYDRFVYEGEHVSLPSILPEFLDRTIITNGFSKVFAMPGWRLGYVAAPSDIAKAITNFQSHSTGSPSTISQIAGISAIAAFDNNIVATYGSKRDLLVDGLNSIDNVSCAKPKGAFYAFPNFSQFIGSKHQDKTITDIEMFCELLLEEQLISAVPGTVFGEPNNIRLNFAIPTDQILEALHRIRNFTKKLIKVK